MKTVKSKKLRYLFFALLLILPVLGLLACSPSLDVPTKLVIDKTTLTLTWNAVPHATSYKIDIDGKEYGSTNAKYSLTFLKEGKHTIKVKARDAANKYGDSSWSSSVSFYKEYESGMVYTLKNANTEYEVSKVGTATGDVVIEDVYRGLPVTSIASRAFYNSRSLKSIVIGKNVTSIGSQAFANCSYLASVEIPDSVTSIGDNAFESCRVLASVKLPDSITSIGNATFRYCQGLAELDLGDGVTSIGVEAFRRCDKLTDVELPSSLQTIGTQAFLECAALNSVKLGGTTVIGEKPFNSCRKLESVTDGDNVESIGEAAFGGCIELKGFVLSDSVKTVGASAFSGCAAFESVTTGSGLEKIGKDAFANTKLYTDNMEGGIIYADKWVIGCDPDITSVSSLKTGIVGFADNSMFGSKITSMAFPATVKYIGDYAFSQCGSLTSIGIGNGVLRIGRYAFARNKILGRGTINLGTSVEVIDSYAFYDCPDFGNPGYTVGREITIPSSVKEIGTYTFRGTYFWNSVTSGIVYLDKWVIGYIDNPETPNVTIKKGTIGISNYAFYKSPTLATITITEDVKIIGKNAFNACPTLARVFIDEFNSITEIGDYAFYKCESLKEVDIPVTVTRIGRSAFYKSGVMSVTLPRKVSEIGPYAFYGCVDLLELNIPADSQLKTINDYAFYRCENLRSVNLPNSLNKIGARAFSKCTMMTSATFGNGLTEIGDLAFNECALRSVVLPDSLTEIGPRAFYKCKSLTSVTFGNNTQVIGANAFAGCEKLASLDLPHTVTTIGDYAFRSCKSLTAVVLRSNIVNIGDHVFNGCSKLTLFAEHSATANEFNARWNSGYRPVMWDCKFGADGDYVTSFIKTATNPVNVNSFNGLSAPVRDGYTFGGWAAPDGTIYQPDELKDVADGTVLTAVWNEIQEDTQD